MSRRLQRGVLFFGLLAILFVVLCPLTPTPSAVIKNAHVSVPLLIVPAISFSLTASSRTTAEFLAPAPLVPLRDLNCVRLC